MAKILVVDDSPTEMHKLCEFLVVMGHTPIRAEDGEAGVQAAITNLPDLILMDVVMPVLNGFQATRKVVKNPVTQHIPVIIVTTKDQETDRVWGLRQGAKDYLVKPVTAETLAKAIKPLLV